MFDNNNEMDDLTSWLLILERIVENSANMVVITDAEKYITWVNNKYTEVTGWTLDEVRGRHAGEMFQGPPMDPEASTALAAALSQSGSVAGVELINYRKSGDPYTVLLNIEPIRDTKGATVAYFSLQSDMTAARSLERERDHLQSQLLHAQKVAGLGRLDFDRKTGDVRWSSEVNTILELDPVLHSGRISFLMNFVEPHAQEFVRRAIDSALVTGELFDQEIPIITTQGSKRWVRCRAFPQHPQDSMITWTVQDVSVYKTLLDLQRQNNDLLQAAVLERTRNLEDAYRALESFSQAISHDLKKPVRHIVSYAEIVKEHIANGELETASVYCGKVIIAGKKMRILIDSILALARFGRRGINPSSVDMQQLLTECLEETTLSWPGRDFAAVGIDTFPTLLADPTLMFEVWRNLLENAFKYSSMRERIFLQFRCEDSAEGWTMSLKDNGCGFDETHAKRIFELFERATPDEAIGGDGIGLALSYRIIKAHGGKIWAESQPQNGAVFYVFVPKKRSD